MILIKNARVFSPKALGKKDVLIAFDKILEVADCIEPWRGDLTVIDAAGNIVSAWDDTLLMQPARTVFSQPLPESGSR